MPRMSDRFSDLRPRPVPPVPPLWAALGPGIVWMALAQGTSELYWWPHFVAKYGALYLCLLIPACVLQTPINLEIGRYTLLTGESVFTGFTRLGRVFSLFLWAYFALCFAFLGGFANLGATALRDIVPWPADWPVEARTLLWSYVITAVFATGLFVSRTVYRLIERFMLAVALFTLERLDVACIQPVVTKALPEFLRGLVVPAGTPAPPRDPKELEAFITLICYSGLGGFWSLFYSFWIREKGYGMSAYVGKITNPVTGKSEPITFDAYRFEDTPENAARYRGWRRTLVTDNAVGVLGNLFTTLLMALLAFALLHPTGRVPGGWAVATEQAASFGVLWGPAARVAFLVVAGCFLMDTWLAGADAVSRVHAEMVCAHLPKARAKGLRFWYYGFLAGMTLLTWATLPFGEPARVVAITGVLSLFAVAVYSVALWILNYRMLAPRYPAWARPHPVQRVLFTAVIVLYLAAACAYAWVKVAA